MIALHIASLNGAQCPVYGPQRNRSKNYFKPKISLAKEKAINF
jgi:hypothetical protein